MCSTKVSIIFSLLLLLAVLASCGGGVGVDSKKDAYAGAAILAWSTPTTYADGQQLPSANIKGYRIYSRTPSGAYNPGTYYFVSAPNTSVSIINLNLQVGQYYFAATTLDISGIESGFSNEVFGDLE